MSHWGMVIDLRKCISCYACVIACKQANFVPKGVFFNRIILKEKGQFPVVRRVAYPVLCNQCDEPPCVGVCPTGATFKREDGIVVVDDSKCIGCQYCVLSCPYQQRTFLDKNEPYFGDSGLTEPEELGRKLRPYTEGTVLKCDFCLRKIEAGLRKGLVPGVDREATPACVNVCMVHCRTFGDLDDPNSNVSRLLSEHDAYTLQPESETRPNVYYIDK